MLTLRSQLLAELLPAAHAGIRVSRMRACYAEEALQQTLVALVPHLERLADMPEIERRAYVFMTANRTAMALRKRIGLEQARGTDAEMYAWECLVARRSETPEELLRAVEGAARAARAFEALDTSDQKIVAAVNDHGLSERDAARELGVPRTSLGYRLKRARDLLERAWLETTSWAGRKRRG